MNIATKLIAGLVAGLVLTACSGGGSSGSSSKPNSELTPKVDMSAPKAEQPKKEEAPQADSLNDEKSKDMKPQVDSPKVEDPKNMAPQMSNSKPNDPQVMAPKMDMPLKDNSKREDLNKNKSNAEILKELGVRDTSGLVNNADVVLNLEIDEKDQIKIVLDKSEINRDSLKVTNAIPTQDIKTLKDSSGKLLGYYGYMQLSQVRQDESYSTDSLNLSNYYLLSMNEQEKTRPSKSLTYKGTMIYGYSSVANNKLEAEVQAQYDHSNKKLSMQIFGQDKEHWRLAEASGSNVKLSLNQFSKVTVSENGDINGRLYLEENSSSKFIPDANFSGGIFGKNGEVLAGKAESINNSWQGVIGATATETNKK
ncbi:transferrin-binding protein-like solute binding protein [Actinobacillus pleuropneumoniae]|uniref:transferrin-binding protein-like solute binding protein n=1 Tax=Actinobacillus pleuropneumoniae TaxID=715 RepID=UPI001C02DE3A|nr:transferrin-binding protein-like solute binding protein [Actinobacillus pleuropneumoniae]MBT9319350.1 transferrin-binding protein-like solute binding protein [Actinobacillus pleuropneumoniae]MBT9344219.1 transferrin-binding protein-like solute binding protein [Actinobacillus pleuropneumoniae]